MEEGPEVGAIVAGILVGAHAESHCCREICIEKTKFLQTV